MGHKLVFEDLYIGTPSQNKERAILFLDKKNLSDCKYAASQTSVTQSVLAFLCTSESKLSKNIYTCYYILS